MRLIADIRLVLASILLIAAGVSAVTPVWSWTDLQWLSIIVAIVGSVTVSLLLFWISHHQIRGISKDQLSARVVGFHNHVMAGGDWSELDLRYLLKEYDILEKRRVELKLNSFLEFRLNQVKEKLYDAKA